MIVANDGMHAHRQVIPDDERSMMLVRRNRFLLIAALFVLAPMAGMVVGVFGGLHLTDRVNEAAVEQTDELAEAGDRPEADESAPELTLPNGEAVGIDELAPKREVAIVVMKDIRCPVCHDQLERLSDRLSIIERSGGTVVGLTDAPACAARGLMSRLDLDFPVVSDTDGEFLDEVDMALPGRSHVMPGIVFVDEDGEVERVHRGRKPGQQEAQKEMIIQALGAGR